MVELKNTSDFYLLCDKLPIGTCGVCRHDNSLTNKKCDVCGHDIPQQDKTLVLKLPRHFLDTDFELSTSLSRGIRFGDGTPLFTFHNTETGKLSEHKTQLKGQILDIVTPEDLKSSLEILVAVMEDSLTNTIREELAKEIFAHLLEKNISKNSSTGAAGPDIKFVDEHERDELSSKTNKSIGLQKTLLYLVPFALLIVALGVHRSFLTDEDLSVISPTTPTESCPKGIECNQPQEVTINIEDLMHFGVNNLVTLISGARVLMTQKSQNTRTLDAIFSMPEPNRQSKQDIIRSTRQKIQAQEYELSNLKKEFEVAVVNIRQLYAENPDVFEEVIKQTKVESLSRQRTRFLIKLEDVVSAPKSSSNISNLSLTLWTEFVNDFQ